MKPITYISQQDADYAKALHEADTLSKLRAMMEEWKELAADAAEIVAAMSEEDFMAWRKGAAKERRGQFAGEEFAEKYGCLSMPKVLFLVSYRAAEFKVPWGLMYLRLKETGNLEKALA